eukprot:6177601-Pleurochrysis_carterae.AAC.1
MCLSLSEMCAPTRRRSRPPIARVPAAMHFKLTRRVPLAVVDLGAISPMQIRSRRCRGGVR